MVLAEKKNGFAFFSDGVEFLFKGNTLPTACGKLFSLEGEGLLPVPEIKKGDRIMLPIDEGVALRAEESYDGGDFDLDNIKCKFQSRSGTMSMIIVERQKKYLLIALKKGIDAGYSLVKNKGLYELGLNTNVRDTVYYGVFDRIIDACRSYRELKETKLITLAEKQAANKEIEKLSGGAVFWIWNDCYDSVMYSTADTDESPLVGADLLKTAEELYDGGIDKAMIGIFFEGDSPLVEPLYRKYGYISTQYDNYSDVWNPDMLDKVPKNRINNCDYTRRRISDYPKGLKIAADGKPVNAWGVKGYDGEYHHQNKLCPVVAVERIKKEVPEILKKFPCYKGRFIDVYGGNLEECHSKEHPVTIEECARVKSNGFKALGDMGLIAGTEDGFEAVINDLVYSEGMHSPDCFRFDDSGRNQAHIHNAEQTEYLKKYMFNPECRMPLWQMVYHDCLLSFAYWGDSTAATPDFTARRTLFCCLFGAMPIYSFSVGNFKRVKDSVLASYKKITEINRKTATLAMTDFEFLTDDYSVARSVFGGKYEVVANFGEKTYVYKEKEILPEQVILTER